MVGVYAVARVKGVEYPLVEVMGTEDIARVRAASQTSRSDSPWRIWPEEMARKSVLKRVLKRAPSSTEMRVAIGMIDDEAKGVPVEDVFPGAFDATKTGDKLADLTASLKQRTEPNPPPKADAKPATKKTPKPDPEPAQEREPGDDGWGSVPQPGDEDYL
jgi:recombinational DNA repair protein RecT